MANYRRARANPTRPSSARTKQFHGDQGAGERVKKLPDAEFLDLAKERFRLATDAEEKQRQREQDDLRFYAGDQWPEDLLTQRQGQAAVGSLPPVPARPCLVVNQALQPVAQVLNQERGMDMGVELLAADDFEEMAGPSDDSEVELREGLIRRIQRASETADARTWAFERAAISGRGYWGLTTKFTDISTTGDRPAVSAWDQEIVVERFFNQAGIVLDPAHESPTGSDAEWGFVGGYMPWDQYTREFPDVAGKKNPLLSRVQNDEDFRALGDEIPTWFTFQSVRGSDGNEVDTGTRMCRVVNYYYTVRTSRELALLEDGTAAWQDTLPKDATPKETRTVITKAIKWAKIDGVQVLERTDWPGPDIPIVKVVGRELQPYNDDRPVQGIVRPMRDSGQAMNYTLSKAMELTVGLPPMAQWIMAAGQDEGYEHEWQLMGVRTIGVGHYNELDASGRAFETKPERINNGPQGVEPLFASIGLLNTFIKDTTLTPAAALGQQDLTQKSGRALQLQIEQSQRGTSNFLDNQARSIRREGEILNNLLYPIYGLRPGRIARVMSSEGETQTVQIGVPPAAPTMPGQPPVPPQPNAPKQVQLTPDAKFRVAIKVSRSYDTLREEVTSVLGEMIQKIPSLMGVVGDKWASGLPVPEAKDIAERIKTTLIPPVQQLLASKAQGGTPPDPHVQQLQQQVQQLGQQLQQAQGDMAGKQLDNQTRLQIAQLDNETRFKIAAMEVQATVQQTQAKIDADMAKASMDAETKKIAAVLDEKVGVAQMLHEGAHATASQLSSQQHETVQNLSQQAHERAMAAQQAVHQQDAAVQQAALTPPDNSSAQA